MSPPIFSLGVFVTRMSKTSQKNIDSVRTIRAQDWQTKSWTDAEQALCRLSIYKQTANFEKCLYSDK